MKSRNNLSPLLLPVIFFGLLVFASCGKEESGSYEEEQAVAIASAESDAEAESTFNEFFDDAMGANNDVGVAGSGIFYGRGDSLTPVPRCFTITITHPSGTPFPQHIVIDFGTTGCAGPDGHTRKGKIIVDYTDKLINAGASATTRFENFYVDAVRVEGTHVITNVSAPLPVLVRKYKVEVINGKLTKPNGNYMEWNSTRYVIQVDGMITVTDPRDDVYKIEGSGHGVVRRDNLLVRWESSIIEPLVRRITCRWIVKGRVKTMRSNLPTGSPWVATLDFGAGNCDNQATLSVNGITRQITLP